mgnify:FL=1
MYPTTNQVEVIHKTFGCTRFVYNHYLNKNKTLYEEKKSSLSCFDMIKDLKNLQVEHPFLKEIYDRIKIEKVKDKRKLR